jgi:hypothetical protein
VRRLPPMCPSCHTTLTDRPEKPRAGTEPPEGRVCGKCGYKLNEAELEKQADELAAALFEELDE